MWRLNNTILKNAVSKEEISRKIFLKCELNISESKTYQNLWDATKEVLRGTLNACISKEERSIINNLSFHLGYQKNKLNPN